MRKMLAALLLLSSATYAQDLAITHVRLFDGERVHHDASVLVRGDRIAAVRTADTIAPSKADRQIDGRGLTLLPGLIDSHTHIQSRDDLVASLAFGVTTDLSLHGQPSSDRAIRGGLAERGASDRADLYTAGFAATAPGGHGTEYGFTVPTITAPSEAADWVDARLAEGSDVIKIMYEEGGENGRVTRPSIDAATLAALIGAAHARNKLAVVHIHTDAQAMQAIRAGADGLAHLYLFGAEEVDPQFGPMLVKGKMFVIPTLTVLRSACGLAPGRDVLEDSRLAPYLREEDRARLGNQIAIAKPSDYDRPRKALTQLLANRVAIVAGTDAHNRGTAPGASLHSELVFLVEGGMTPVQALRAATSTPAKVFHWPDRGRVAAGLRADLLLVDGDPTVDITATRNIRAVWKSGVEFDRAGWRQRVATRPASGEGSDSSTAASNKSAEQSAPQGMVHLPGSVAEWAQGAVLFEGLGNVHRVVRTSSGEAQRYFDQGMSLVWGFNHDEATRSFAKSAALDPHCAACYWGVSLTVGPNYNLPFLSEERAAVAFEALQKAESEAAQASPVEQALISALARRYPNAKPLDQGAALPVLTEYAMAMKEVAQRFPDDLDVQTLYAESMMNLHAWKLWTPNGAAAPGTAEILATLEAVLARDPRHPGANHYYVHAMEASPHPEKAVTSAERLRDLMPGAGHLVHMPAHIFQRIGRYEEAAEANRRAAKADEKYDAMTTPPDYYPVMYTAHNYQFLAYSAAMEGRRAETIDAVNRSRSAVSDSMLLEMPGTDWYVAEYYTARVRFGLWDDLLATPAPDRRLPGLLGGYLYGRAMAQAATGRVADARASLGSINALVTSLPTDTAAGQNQLRDVLSIASAMIEARIASAERRPRDEIDWLRKAVGAEDRIAYDEPKNWFVPTRHALGAALLRSGAAREAEAVYREDLLQNPANGWALCGLRAALEAQGKRAEAAAVADEFNRAWRNADVSLSSSEL